MKEVSNVGSGGIYVGRLTRAQKERNDKQWYKDSFEYIFSRRSFLDYGGSYDGMGSRQKKIKVNFDLFNGQLDKDDFISVIRPFGVKRKSVDKLPDNFRNMDILSMKINSVLGIEMNRPFIFRVSAVNPEVTNDKMEREIGMYKDYVVENIMAPIRQQVMEQAIQSSGGEVDDEARAQIQQQINAEIEERTPEKVRNYMQRDHRESIEVMMQHLMNYIKMSKNTEEHLHIGCKHAMICGEEVYYIGERNGDLFFSEVHPRYFYPDIDVNKDFIEDGEWCSCDWYLSPSDVVSMFGDELSGKEIDDMYSGITVGVGESELAIVNRMWNQGGIGYVNENNGRVKVVHCVWKGLRNVKRISFTDEEGNISQAVVDETYKVNEDVGEVLLENLWIPEVYECYKIIGIDKYVRMRPIPGQDKLSGDLYSSKLPYYGCIYREGKNKSLSLLDRGKEYQYYYNVIMYRIQLLMSSDKGKKIMIDKKVIPENDFMDVEKFMHFVHASSVLFVDGVGGQDTSTMPTQLLDLGQSGDISRYQQIAEYINQQCMSSMGISPQMLAQLGNREAAANTQAMLRQSANILEPFFIRHNRVKKNIYTALLEASKWVYKGTGKMKLEYVLDDLDMAVFELESDRLENVDFGIFVSEQSDYEVTKDNIMYLAQAGLQNGLLDFKTILELRRTDSELVAKEIIERMVDEKKEEASKAQEQQMQLQQQQQQFQMELLQRQHQNKLEEIAEKGRWDVKRISTQMLLTGASFNPDTDRNADGTNDYLESAQKGLENVDLRAKGNPQSVAEKKVEYDHDIALKKIELEERKLKQDKK